MSVGLGGPAGVFVNPGPDVQTQTLSYHLQQALAIMGRDGALSPDEQRDFSSFMGGVQAIAMQRTGGAQQAAEGMGGGSDETSDFGSSPEGNEPAGGPDDGNSYAQLG